MEEKPEQPPKAPEEPESQPEQAKPSESPKSGIRTGIREFIQAIMKSGDKFVSEKCSFLEPVWQWFKKWFPRLERNYQLILIGLGIGVVCVYGTNHFVSNKYESVLSETNSFWSNTNSFYKGQFSAVSEQFNDYRHDAENQILNLKQDKATLTAEVDADKIRIDQLESLPETAFLAYSNASASLQMERPNFNVMINSQPLTNLIFVAESAKSAAFYVMSLETNRVIHISVTSGERSIKDLTVEFMSNMDTSNIVSGIADGWWKPEGLEGSDLERSSIVEVAQGLMIEGERFDCTPIVISQKYDLPYVHTTIALTAPGLYGVQRIRINFLISQSNQSALKRP